MDANVPLVVANVNDDRASHNGIVANPNCTTMALMMAAGPLHRAAGLRAMTATSYQSVSGSAKPAWSNSRELAHFGQDTMLVAGGWTDPGGDVYMRPIAYNVLPLAGSITDAGTPMKSGNRQ